MANADQGFGTTITFSSGFLALVTGLRFGGIHRDPINTTHMTTTNGWDTSIPSDIKTMGTLEVDILYDPDDSPKTPITAAAATVTVTFPIPSGGSVAATIACSGYMTDFSIDDPMDDRMTATAVIQYTGEPTFTAGS